MIDRLTRGQASPHPNFLSQPEPPLQLDEWRLDAWALALGQQREGPADGRPHRGQLPDLSAAMIVPAPPRASLARRLAAVVATLFGRAPAGGAPASDIRAGHPADASPSRLRLVTAPSKTAPRTTDTRERAA